MRPTILTALSLAACLAVPLVPLSSQDATKRADVKGDELGSTRNVHSCGDLFLAGQFAEADLAVMKERGIRRIITLRTDGELSWNEKEAAERAEFEFVAVPFRGPDTLTDEIFDEVRELLATSGKPTMLHCGGATRVAAVWLPFRVLDEGVPLDRAVKEAREVGRIEGGFEDRALEYIAKKIAEKKASTAESVKPGINENFLDPELDVDRFVGRFESESREVYAARDEVLEACAISTGDRVADIGAGTGLYTLLFSGAVGAEGWVWAVDIAPPFLAHIREDEAVREAGNVSTVLCSSRSVGLPPASADVAFICDTYHHFEYPAAMLASIHRALGDGGRLIVIDFERIPGTSREWILGHVRAGREEVEEEITAAGFERVRQIELDGLEENWMVEFRKR